ncbi:MAG: glycosyltransferase [Puniceicoccaceae bacterium]
MYSLSPIALFAYQRLESLHRTLETLRRNELANESELYVFSDGAKSDEEAPAVLSVREKLRAIKGFQKVHLVERPENFGLARNIIDGVSWVLKQYESVIVLEDDIETSPGFLRYMNDALECYRNEPKVMHVSGYMFPVKGKLPSTFFYNTASCWGWGTWRDRWQQAEWDAVQLCEQIEHSGRIADFNIGNTYPYFDHLRKNTTGEMRSWAVRWYANLFIKGGFALHPFPSLTQNIGMDGQGTHCGVSDRYIWSELANHVPVKPIELRQSRKCILLMKQFHASRSRTLRRSFRIRRIARRIFQHCAAWVARGVDRSSSRNRKPKSLKL